jgi:hypothetical protein
LRDEAYPVRDSLLTARRDEEVRSPMRESLQISAPARTQRAGTDSVECHAGMSKQRISDSPEFADYRADATSLHQPAL